jgi:hypothetical protein
MHHFTLNSFTARESSISGQAQALSVQARTATCLLGLRVDLGMGFGKENVAALRQFGVSPRRWLCLWDSKINLARDAVS